jgi:hypothetical protein
MQQSANERNRTMTKVQKKAIKRICADYDFENTKELKEYLKDSFGDTLDEYWFNGSTEEECYAELERVVRI